MDDQEYARFVFNVPNRYYEKEALPEKMKTKNSLSNNHFRLYKYLDRDKNREESGFLLEQIQQ